MSFLAGKGVLKVAGTVTAWYIVLSIVVLARLHVQWGCLVQSSRLAAGTHLAWHSCEAGWRDPQAKAKADMTKGGDAEALPLLDRTEPVLPNKGSDSALRQPSARPLREARSPSMGGTNDS